MRPALVILMLLVGALAIAENTPAKTGPFAEWPYRLGLRVESPALSDHTGLARVSVNMGGHVLKDAADVRILDEKGREQAWKLESQSDAGDLTILFQTVKGIRDYSLIFGNVKAPAPKYPASVWPRRGRVLIDDFLPRNAHTHGLWHWARDPALSGSFSHTSPITRRTSIHGTSNLSNQKVRGAFRVPLRSGDEIFQYVMLDPDDPPKMIGLRLVFEQRFNSNVWDPKRYVNLTWGRGNLDVPKETRRPSGRRRSRFSGVSGRTIPMGELPPTGHWVKLSITVEDLMRRASEVRWRDGGTPDLFGVEFVTDGGRAWWDLTTLGRAPASTQITGFEREPGAPPVIVTRRLDSFTLEKEGPALSRVQCFVAAPEDTSCEWRFHDGRTSTERSPVQLIENVGGRKTTVVLAAPDSGREIVTEELPVLKDVKRLPVLELGIDVRSCPFIARRDGNALFNLRIEGMLPHAMDMKLTAVQLDSSDRELRRAAAVVTVWPGDKHPTFRAFSLDFGAGDLARIRFELLLEGRRIAERLVNVYSSKSNLSTLTLKGDRYVDRLEVPVVVREEIAGPEQDVGRQVGLPWRSVLIGDMPVGEPAFDERLRRAFLNAGKPGSDIEVTKVAPKPFPAWSLPARLALAVNAKNVPETTDAVIIAAATQMMLADVPADTAADTIGVVIDQLRRVRPRAAVMLVIPSIHDGFEDVSRQYAMTLKVLGIRKRVQMVDLYSRSALLAEKAPDVLKTSRITDGVLTRTLSDRMIDELLDAIIEEFSRTVSLSSE